MLFLFFLFLSVSCIKFEYDLIFLDYSDKNSYSAHLTFHFALNYTDISIVHYNNIKRKSKEGFEVYLFDFDDLDLYDCVNKETFSSFVIELLNKLHNNFIEVFDKVIIRYMDFDVITIDNPMRKNEVYLIFDILEFEESENELDYVPYMFHKRVNKEDFEL